MEMISDPNIVLRRQQDVLEGNNKNIISSTHNTDTEPEAEADTEVENSQGHKQSEIIIKCGKNNETSQRKHKRNGFTRLIDKLPSYEYDVPSKSKSTNTKKKSNDINDLVPLDIRNTDNNRFASYQDAFLYIASHCRKYHNKFTRERCREYLKYCYIIDFAHDEFIPITTSLSTKEFNKLFQKTNREMKYL